MAAKRMPVKAKNIKMEPICLKLMLFDYGYAFIRV